MGLTKKLLLKRENQRQKALFALSDREALTIHPASILPWSTFSRKLIILTQNKIQ